MSTSNQIVSKLWSYCNLLRDDGLSYPDYVEQLTLLIFLKMASEQSNQEQQHGLIPKEYNWSSLLAKRGNALHSHYTKVLEFLAGQGQMLSLIFGGARNRIRDPDKLHKLIVDLIDKENWTAYDADIKGEAYEGLLEKTAQDSKSGAGQYFTPRPLIRAIVEVMRPEPGHTVCDPATGTCGFLLGVREYIVRHYPKMTVAQIRHQRTRAYHGVELVESVARLGAMNLYLHGIGPDTAAGQPPISVKDSLHAASTRTYDLVLTNPPFGKKSSIPSSGKRTEAGRNGRLPTRKDFWATTANKQLNFLQHVTGMLSPGGRAALVIPDNVLFERGVGEIIRRRLLESFNVHTLLRLPTGLFYAQGVKANVIFFDKPTKLQMPATKRLWVYDLRTDLHFTLKTKRMRRTDLDEFIQCYGDGSDSSRKETWTKGCPNGRWRAYSYKEIDRRTECNLDLTWITPAASVRAQNIPSADSLARSITADLRIALSEIEKLSTSLSMSGR